DLARMGFRLCATRGTAQALAEIGIEAETVLKIREGRPNIVDRLHQNDIQLVINTLTRGREPERDGFKIRRTAAEHGIPCLTSLDTAKAFFAALTAEKPGPKRIYPLQDLSLPDTKGQEGK
ncbi:MAG: carbamoyl-phosphate synthase large subunit, partial [Clostridia bacterium]|nr:carbamoyl-phosphate synthase large subunit [Clostridia bacterium]